MKLIIPIVWLLIVQMSYSQTAEEEKEFWYMATFEMTNHLFKKSNYFYKSQQLERDKILIKPTNRKEDLLLAIDYLKENGSLFIEKDHANYLVFKSELPEVFKSEPSQVYTFSLISHRLEFENGAPLKLINAESNSIGLNFEFRNQIDFSENLDHKLTGTASYEVKFISDYATHKISKKDIGNQIKLNNNDYLIVDIFDNKLVIKPLSARVSDLGGSHIKLIVLDKTGKNQLVPYSYQELEDLEKNNSKYKDAKTFASSVSLIKEEVYHQFRDGSEINLEKFKAMVSLEELQDYSLNGKYLVFEHIAPLENEIILYEPIYGISKIIEIEL